MAEGLSIVSGVVGGIVALVGQGVLKWLDHRRSERAEQRKLAQELLTRTEAFCKEVARRRWQNKEERPNFFDDPLDAMRDEISSLAVGLQDPVARQHMETIGSAMWFVSNPKLAEHHYVLGARNPYPIRLAAREVLGAVQRGKTVPVVLNADFKKLAEAADDLDKQIEHDIRVQEEYAEEKQEEERQKRLAAAASNGPVTAPSDDCDHVDGG